MRPFNHMWDTVLFRSGPQWWLRGICYPLEVVAGCLPSIFSNFILVIMCLVSITFSWFNGCFSMSLAIYLLYMAKLQFFSLKQSISAKISLVMQNEWRFYQDWVISFKCYKLVTINLMLLSLCFYWAIDSNYFQCRNANRLSWHKTGIRYQCYQNQLSPDTRRGWGQ